ncbi:MAG TPA: hypothetical protein VG845_08175 [Dehalococcoidia bacterium]|nr:hypothetical protein [Dehalococcoidia bacterium]
MSTANAQEPQADSCLLSELVLLGSAPGAGTQDAAVMDVAFPGDACMFLRSSFANTFDLGTFNPGSGIEAPDAAVRGQYAGGCDLIEVVGAVVTETPALAEAMGPVPELSLSEQTCDSLLTTYSLLATGGLTPLSAPAAPSIVPTSGTPPGAPLDRPLGMETSDTGEFASDAGTEEGEAAPEAAANFTAGCNVNDLIDDFVAEVPELALPEDGASEDEAADAPASEDAAPDDTTTDDGDVLSDDATDEAASDEEGFALNDEAIAETPDDELSAEGCESLASVFGRAAALINGEPADEPSTDEPATDEPVTDEPVTDEPSAEERTTDGRTTDEPVTDEPVTDEPTTDEPVTDEPVTDEPATDEPGTDEPVTDEPATDEPAATGDSAAPGPEGGPLTVEPVP